MYNTKCILLLLQFLVTDLVSSDEKLCNFDFSPALLSKIFNLKPTLNLPSLLEELKTIEITEKEIELILYAEDNKTYSLYDDENLKLLNSDFTKIIIHGWQSTGKEPWVKEMASKYHKKGKYNIIAVDWSKHSKKNYLHAVTASQYVGEFIADFVLKTEKKVENFSKKLHLIGHSLGAQISGFVGKKLKESGLKLDRITGCDAAAPLFEFPVKKSSKCSLTKTDADFVDLIHTEELGGYGVTLPYGHVDFYVNAGLHQPNCTKTLLDFFNPVSCGHASSHQIFSQTITNPKAYEATSCSNLLSFKTGLCNGNAKAFLGDSVNRSASGKFFIKITSEDFNNAN